MKIKSQKDFWSGLMFVVVGVGFAWGALGYNFGTSARPGPGYFPFGLGVLVALLGAFILFKALTIESPGGDAVGHIAWKPLGIVVGSVALFGVTLAGLHVQLPALGVDFRLPSLGMAVSLPVLVLLASSASDEFSLKEALINAAVLTVGSWLIFIKGLGLTIPLWPALGGAAG